MTTRSEQIDHFLQTAGWGDAVRSMLAGDASFRRYERVTGQGRKAVLMDAPPVHEDVRPFMRVDALLTASGMSAPRILASDTEQGFLLLEDLGDDLYSQWLRRNQQDEAALYQAAADVLAELYHLAPRADYSAIAPYDYALMMRECMLFADWFLAAVMEPVQAKHLGEEFAALWQNLLTELPQDKPVLVLRDYHADNLLWLPERKGIANVGLLDFQDAVIGSPAYDMVSFLEDARRDVAPSTVTQTIAHYLERTGQNEAQFMTSYALLGAQRNCKIIGIFVRLAVRDGKASYLSYLPRVWKHLERDLSHPLLASLKTWLDKHIPSNWRGEIAVAASSKKASA